MPKLLILLTIDSHLIAEPIRVTQAYLPKPLHPSFHPKQNDRTNHNTNDHPMNDTIQSEATHNTRAPMTYILPDTTYVINYLIAHPRSGQDIFTDGPRPMGITQHNIIHGPCPWVSPKLSSTVGLAPNLPFSHNYLP